MERRSERKENTETPEKRGETESLTMRVKGERREVMWSEYRSWKKWKRHEERADRCRSDSAESHGDLIMDREKSTSRRADPQPS